MPNFEKAQVTLRPEQPVRYFDKKTPMKSNIEKLTTLRKDLSGTHMFFFIICGFSRKPARMLCTILHLSEVVDGNILLQ